MAIKRKNTSLQSPVHVQNKGKERIGKGSHMLYMIQQLMKDVENWVTITDKEQYHYPGTQQVIMHCRDITATVHAKESPLFMGWYPTGKKEFQKRSFGYIYNRWRKRTTILQNVSMQRCESVSHWWLQLHCYNESEETMPKACKAWSDDCTIQKW